MRNKMLALLMAASLILMGPLSLMAADGASPQDEIRISVDGIWLEPDVPPLIENGRTLVPFAILLRALGAHVDWQEDTKTVVAVRGRTEIRLTVDSRDAVINEPETGDRTVTMDVPTRIISGRTMVPLRFAAEQLGATVMWNGAERTVTVDSLQPIGFEVLDPADIGDLPGLRQSWLDDHLETYGIHSLMTADWIYVLAGAGERPTGGYEMTVTEVRPQPGRAVYVTAVLTVPGPHEQVTQALTYPHQLIRFPADGIESVGGVIREEVRREEPTTEELTLNLYFMQDTGTSFVAVSEQRTFEGPQVGARELFEALLEGPQSDDLMAIIPEDTVLLDVYLDDGILYLNVSADIREGPFGAETEAVLVSSIVGTMMQLDRVEAIQMLVNGEIIESIAGHVQIDVPLK